MIAPTGSGKGRDFLIPNLLTYPGPVVVLDPKGELSAVCGRAREALGQRVIVLDPFDVTGRVSDRLNPLDQFSLEGAMLEPDAEMLASLLSDDHGSQKEPFWPDTASNLIAGCVAYIAACEPPERRNMKSLRDMVLGGDTVMDLAKLLDAKGGRMPPFAYKALTGFLEHADSQTRPSVLSTARTFLTAMNSDQVVGCMSDSTFSLADVVEGKPLSIFITIPPEKAKSHRSLMRFWVGALLTAVMRRKRLPRQRTLFVLDEAAQFGAFEPLLTAATLLRGYGLQLITVWQDLAQMKTRYPQDWATILNNAAVLLSFGFGHYNSAKEYSDVVGVDPRELVSFKPEEAVLAIRGEGTRKVGRINYLLDQSLEGLFDPNPYFVESPQPEAVAVKTPKTWLQKVKHARQAFQKTIKESRREGPEDEETERILGALLHLTDALEEIGRQKKGPDVEKKPRRGKGGERNA